MSTIEKKIKIDGHDISIGPLSSTNILSLAVIVRKEEWEFSDEDMSTFYRLYPKAYIGAYLEDGTLIGKILVITINLRNVIFFKLDTVY